MPIYVYGRLRINANTGLRPAIDPGQIPSPVEIQSIDQDKWFRESYLTCSTDQPVPLSTSEFHAIDQGTTLPMLSTCSFSPIGNSSPRFIRASTYAVPESQELTRACRIPLGVVVQPFAQSQSEDPIPLVDFQTSGPPRCSRCRAYINPWCAFSHGGSRWTCNLCTSENEGSFSWTQMLSLCDVNHPLQSRKATFPPWTRLVDV